MAAAWITQIHNSRNTVERACCRLRIIETCGVTSNRVIRLVLLLLCVVSRTSEAAPNRCGGTVSVGAGTYREIIVPGANETLALGLNERGDVVGVYRVNSDGGHAFLLRRGDLFTYDVPGAVTTGFIDINDAGTIVGYSAHWGENPYAFVYKQGSLRIISVPGAEYVVPRAINNSETIVGIMSEAGTGKQSSFVLAKDGALSFVEFPGAAETHVTDIRTNGEVIGLARLHDNNQFFSFTLSHGEFSIISPCADGFEPSGFVGATASLWGTTQWPNLPSYGYVGFMESPQGLIVIDYPGDNATFMVGANARGEATGQFADEIGYHSFFYSPR
jgi:probable HAF family extracellular repeat protein